MTALLVWLACLACAALWYVLTGAAVAACPVSRFSVRSHTRTQGSGSAEAFSTRTVRGQA